jgi:hypothetical protein
MRVGDWYTCSVCGNDKVGWDDLVSPVVTAAGATGFCRRCLAAMPGRIAALEKRVAELEGMPQPAATPPPAETPGPGGRPVGPEPRPAPAAAPATPVYDVYHCDSCGRRVSHPRQPGEPPRDLTGSKCPACPIGRLASAADRP